MTSTFTLERTYDASPELVWELWTTSGGIESWWGPAGFAVVVESLDLRPGGELRYAMTAVHPEMVAFMEREKMALTTPQRCLFEVVSAPRRLVYTSLADFIPAVEPYPVTTRVELVADGQGTQVTVTVDRMHDELWTTRSHDGWASQLDRLETTLRAAAS